MAQRFEVEHMGVVTVARFLDRGIVSESDVRHIGDELGRLIGAGESPRLVLNFINVKYLSSSMLGKLIKLNSSLEREGGRLALCHIDRQVYEVFETTNLKKLFHIYADEEEAVNSF